MSANCNGSPCRRHESVNCVKCARHWHCLPRNEKKIADKRPHYLQAKWLRFSTTIWAESEQYAVGLTTGDVSEVFVDKVAIWCYETYIYDNLCAKVPALKGIVDALQSNVFGTSSKLRLQQQAAGMINRVLFRKSTECKGVRVFGENEKCSSHTSMHEIPENAIVGMICRLVSESSVHEIIHASLFEYNLLEYNAINENEINPHEVTEATVYDYAMQIAGTADIARSRVT